jgi:putative nucleotidyltransferase with HDIG domain
MRQAHKAANRHSRREAERMNFEAGKAGRGSNLSGYHRVSIRLLRLGEMASFPLFIKGQDGKPVLYRERNLRFTEENRRRLAEHGLEALYVPAADMTAYRNYVEANLGAILAEPNIAPEAKSEAIYESLTWVIEDTMRDPRAAAVVPRSRKILAHTTGFLYEQRGALEHLMRVMSFDYGTYTHSINVFLFAMALGQRIFAREELQDAFGLGALLHDVGKCQIPDEILNCKGRLTDEQFDIMKQHTVYGYEILKEKSDMAPLALAMVRNHHERYAGGGYPDGLEGEQIPVEVRVLTIADIFDALTTRRSYKDPMPTFHALKLIRSEMMSHVDPRIFRVFVTVMGTLPAV